MEDWGSSYFSIHLIVEIQYQFFSIPQSVYSFFCMLFYDVYLKVQCGKLENTE
jgi:hypothetical protein